MNVLKTFRHEYKYVIPYDHMLNIRNKLDKLLKKDMNKESYSIRSLYFDSMNDNDYYDKLSGSINRKKIRLRIYDGESNLIKLEIKNKYDIHQLKESLIISKKDANDLIKGNYNILLKYNNEVSTKIYTIMMEGYYKPKVIIEYDRSAYVTSTTTRITFDYNIKNSYDFDNFFNKEINYTPLTDKKDIVLEVKFNTFLEPYISKILSTIDTRMQSVSKYVMGRNI